MGQDPKMNLTRLPGWESRLNNYVVEHLTKTFDRASFECSRFCVGGIFQLTGVDVAEDVLQQFSDDESAARLVESFESKTMSGEADRVFGMYGIYQCNWKMMQRGDPCCFEIRGHEAMAISLGAVAITPAKKGFLQLPVTRAKLCWKIL